MYEAGKLGDISNNKAGPICFPRLTLLGFAIEMNVCQLLLAAQECSSGIPGGGVELRGGCWDPHDPQRIATAGGDGLQVPIRHSSYPFPGPATHLPVQLPHFRPGYPFGGSI